MVPIRFVFRSRWAALLWSAGICLSALDFAGERQPESVNAANAVDSLAAVGSALNAEDAN